MRSRLKYLVYYFSYWLIYFTLFRAIFLLYHSSESAGLNGKLLGGIFVNGFKMDLSFTAYLSLFVYLMISISVFLSPNWLSRLVKAYTIFLLVFITFLQVVDLEIFKEWGFRLDATPLAYINTPREMAVSASSSPYAWLIGFIILLSITAFKFYQRYIHRAITFFPRISPFWAILFLIITIALIIPIRGGFQLAPLNQSVAFFSANDFANQAALNVPWNVFRSITQEMYSNNNPYQVMPESEAQQLISGFYKQSGAQRNQILSLDRPNVVIILWESLTSKALSELGGDYHQVLPEFKDLLSQGILFTNFYASGDRSDKGLVAVLSGFPALPKKSIVKVPVKSSQLPILSQDFNRLGYHTSFYHGGELEFANIKTYLIHGAFDRVVGRDAFNKKDMNSKWGAHDHIVLGRVLEELGQQNQPFFSMIFTLSSHEPFEIPIESKYPDSDLTSKYLSSLHYTDRSVGEFIREAKKTPWYSQTLFIILADHGHRLLGEDGRYQAEKYHIPMLWLGGALTVRDTIVDKYSSQTDLPKTLLNQLNADATAYTWSRDIFNSGSSKGAFYVFNDGISFIDPDGVTIYDHLGQQVMDASTTITPARLKLNRAHLQQAYQNYLEK